jgi:hypothetical protein
MVIFMEFAQLLNSIMDRSFASIFPQIRPYGFHCADFYETPNKSWTSPIPDFVQIE